MKKSTKKQSQPQKFSGKSMICIVCPNGCQLTVTPTSKGPVVSGNKCPKGESYGISELTAPMRTVTAVVRTTSHEHPCVSVKTSGPIPKSQIPDLLTRLYQQTISLPVSRGECMINNFNETGISVVYTRTLSASSC